MLCHFDYYVDFVTIVQLRVMPLALALVCGWAQLCVPVNVQDMGQARAKHSTLGAFASPTKNLATQRKAVLRYHWLVDRPINNDQHH